MTKTEKLLTVATLNTWHGLDGKGTMFFGGLESRRERMARLDRQLNCLKVLNADVLLLQEVNPLPFRAHWYAHELDKRCFFATSNSGVKFGWGPPSNLNEGLAVLFPRQWEAEDLGKRRLSGRFRLAPFTISEVGSPFLSLQLHESRMGMAVRLHLPSHYQTPGFQGAKSIIVAVTHLHHSPSLTPRNQAMLDEAKAEGLTGEEEAHLLRCFRSANSRRLLEFDNLVTWLERLRLPGEPIILGGDFNCEPESSPILGLGRRGWLDLWQYAGMPEDYAKAATWDPPRNTFAYRAQKFHQVGSSFSEKAAEVLRKTDAVPRRIDYIFAYPWKQAEVLEPEDEILASGKLLSINRFGYIKGNGLSTHGLQVEDFSDLEKQRDFDFGADADLNHTSDHFGLVARFGI
jgi:endonuclease/exonuclease/phosphatase family metal-dependent hydrolase